jgi:superfamily II DNA or RNA helicase
VRQAAHNLEIETGECVGIEKASERSDGQRLVVASVQSMNQARLDRLGKNRFQLVIFDEAHNALAPTFRRALEYFDAKQVGVTATPDRGDEKSLGQLFETVSYCYDILNGIGDGYLVRVDAQQVHLDAIDLNGVDTSAGDFVAAQLDEVMLKCVEGVCTEVLRISGERQGVVFWPGVRSAEHASNRMNSMRAGVAGWISGNTPDDERRETLRQYKAGEIQFLHNCMILIEGFDAPNTSVIAMARPTKSRKLYAQCAGRGTRVLPGVVDHLPAKDDAALRQRLIAESAKPSMLLLDFVGNAGKHSLMGPVDILGGDHSEEEIKEAKKRLNKSGATDVRQALKEARARLKAAAQAITSKVSSRTSKFDPFAVLGVNDGEGAKYARRFGFKPATVGQREGLKKWKFTEEDGLNELSVTEARRIMDELGARARAGLASYGQLKMLRKYGVTEKDITFERAKSAMNYLQQKGWGKRGPVDPQALLDIIYHKRDAGDDT